MNKVPDNVLEKIEKILNLAENNPSGEEAATAAGMAKELLDKYNLTKEDILLKNEGIIETEAEISGTPIWIRRLTKIVAEYYDCKALTRPNYKRTNSGYMLPRFKMVMIGFPKDTKVAQYTLIVFKRMAERAAKKHCSGLGITGHRAFKEGFVCGIGEQLKEKKAAENKGNEEGLVHLKEAKIVEFLSQYNFRAGSRGTPVYGGVYDKGINAGQNAHVNSGINAGQNRTKLLR
ncbi:MAG: DUF2786 domain-containing protein [Thermodesulfobacteriota bacterium]